MNAMIAIDTMRPLPALGWDDANTLRQAETVRVTQEPDLLASIDNAARAVRGQVATPGYPPPWVPSPLSTYLPRYLL